MRKGIKKAADFLLRGFVRVVWAIWTLLTWTAYRPRIVYEDETVNQRLESEPCILVANHTSHHDGSFIPQVLFKCPLNVVVTKKWYDKKAFNWMFRNLKYISIDLDSMSSEWIEKAEAALHRGESVLIFPAGKLVTDGTLGELHPGFLMLAKFTDAPVIPLISRGGYKMFRRQELIVGSEIAFDVHMKGRPSVVMREGTEVCKKQMERMLNKQI